MIESLGKLWGPFGYESILNEQANPHLQKN